ncbi:hypothetical protein V2J81_02710 [Pseudomonas alliivorans]|nr:hypothetical protein [Pseudomonas alliivorans]
MNDTGFAFVLNNLNIDDLDLPFVLDEKSTLRRATPAEVSHFEELLKSGGIFARGIVPHGSVIKKASGNSGPGRYVPPEKTALLIIETKNFNHHVSLLNLAGKLADYDLTLAGYTSYSDEKDRTKFGMSSLFNHAELVLLDSFTRNEPVHVSRAELEQLALYYKIIESKAKDAWLGRALTIFGDINSLPVFSELRTLSYFSVLECLLTKKASGGSMSIDKQLQNKTELLFNFSSYKTDPASYFGGINLKKLWRVLYELRSNIAHGNVYSFTGDLSCLKDLQNVNQFLSGLARQILRTAVNQYQLVADLREC